MASDMHRNQLTPSNYKDHSPDQDLILCFQMLFICIYAYILLTVSRLAMTFQSSDPWCSTSFFNFSSCKIKDYTLNTWFKAMIIDMWEVFILLRIPGFELFRQVFVCVPLHVSNVFCQGVVSPSWPLTHHNHVHTSRSPPHPPHYCKHCRNTEAKRESEREKL